MMTNKRMTPEEIADDLACVEGMTYQRHDVVLAARRAYEQADKYPAQPNEELTLGQVIDTAIHGDIFDVLQNVDFYCPIKSLNGELWYIDKDGEPKEIVTSTPVSRKLKYILRKPVWEDCTREEAEQGLVAGTHEVRTDEYIVELDLYDRLMFRYDNGETEFLLHNLSREWQRRCK